MNKYFSIVLCVPLWLACTQNGNGQVIVNPDGTHSIVTGNVIVNPNGTHSVIHGNIIVNPNGSHSVIHGNILVGPDGSHTFFDNLNKKRLAKENVQRKSPTIASKNRESLLFLLFGINNNRKGGAKKEK